MIPRTYLFVPGNRPGRFAKALSAGADRVVLDLEDAVAATDKAGARQQVADWLITLDPAEVSRLVVRINDAHSECHSQDLDWLKGRGLCAVMLSKCESVGQVQAVKACLAPGAEVLALVETAKGVLAAPELAASGAVSRLVFGSLDFMLDLDLPGPGSAVDMAAFSLVLVSRAGGLASPVAGVTAALHDEQVQSDWAHARSLGFGAKLCIHPMQVAAVHKALVPDADQLAWARRVVSAWQGQADAGALQVDGHMVDRPVLLRAQRILASSGQTQ
ncbi:HpcH/HpaI aldolase/citrate lyase family protein [Amphibiibacter pelophylacis]|uniref:CoA ester lyase n=1 Tax=Amphibiibacter pelophylacis TaxID=1799477 RepID=A0ACC6NZN3_9BURK